MKKASIISVTGTKGKSSVVQLIASVLDQAEPYCLRVDSNGVYIGTRQLANVAEAMDQDGHIPTVVPGRYLEAAEKTTDWSHSAVLECSIGCSRHGLGYDKHDIGIFTNIYEDHLGKHLPAREDLAHAKSFIATHVKDGGYLVYNNDEPLIVTIAQKEAARVHLVSVGIEKDAEWMADAEAIYYQGSVVVRLDALPWLIDTSNTPYVYNALFVAAALHCKGMSPGSIATYLPLARLDPAAGRMELLGTPSSVQILLTFAHEAVSLEYAYKLARRLAGNHRTMIATRLRTSYKSPHLIDEFAKACSDFDEIIIYEKTITYEREKAFQPRGPILQKAFTALGRDVQYIADEREALERLVEQAAAGDVIVHIVNGDTAKSRKITQELLT